MPKDFRDLLVWQESIELVKMIDFAAQSIPAEEQCGLAAEMREHATAIPSLIARGIGTRDREMLMRCLRKANRAIIELDTRVMIAQGMEYIDECAADALMSMSDQIGRRIEKAIHSIQVPVRRTRRPR